MDKPNCGGCKFFKEPACHRHAPAIQLNEYMQLKTVYGADDTTQQVPVKRYGESTPVWPTVAVFDWCGEWEKKDES